MSKTFKFAGVSKREGSFKARFANDQMRVKVLAKTGSSDIDLIELTHPMTKLEAVAFLLKINFDNGNALVREALEAYAVKHDESAEKPEKAPKVKAEPKAKAPAKTKSKPSLDAIAARAKAAKPAKSTVSKAEVVAQLADLEDAPF
jgi:hypothetical protein